MSLKASISGIRGIVGDSLTPQVIIDYISAFTKVIPSGKILLGMDSRISGKMISQLVKGTLNSLGRNVVDIGIVPTPVVLFGVSNNDFAGGIIITASHNPEEWNALKLVNSKGKFISPKEFQILTDFYNKKDFNYNGYDKLGSNSEDYSIKEDHLKKIFSFIDSNSIRNSGFKVALDSVNGAGGLLTSDFLRMLNCSISGINIEPTGKFGHPPEPKPENLGDLSDLIKKEKADVGFALDPDADRLVVADETGTVLFEELTLALCVRHYLKNYNKSDIVINLSTSRIVEDICNDYGCKVLRVPTGEINVTEKMEELDSKIGGEGNGGIILPALNKCRDAVVGIALILEMLSREKKKLSDIVKEIPQYIFIKDKIKAENVDFNKVFDEIKVEFKDKDIDTQDGIRINFSDKWLLVRKSNTEPIIRIFAEAKTEKECNELIGRVKKLI